MNYHTDPPKKKRIINGQDIANISVVIAAHSADEDLLNWVTSAMNEKLERDGE